MVKRTVAGIEVPAVADSKKFRAFVHEVYLACGENSTRVARLIGDINPATIWKLEEGIQKDSQVIRDELGIRKTQKRPRVWMPTNNMERAVEVFLTHYPSCKVIYPEGYTISDRARATKRPARRSCEKG